MTSHALGSMHIGAVTHQATLFRDPSRSLLLLLLV